MSIARKIAAVYAKHCAGCHLHVVVDDGNVEEEHIRSALVHAGIDGCMVCYEAGEALLGMSEDERMEWYQRNWGASLTTLHMSHCHAMQTGIEADCNCSVAHVGVYDRSESSGHGLGRPDEVDSLALLPGEPDRAEVLEALADNLNRDGEEWDTFDDERVWAELDTQGRIEVTRAGFVYRLRLDAVSPAKQGE